MSPKNIHGVSDSYLCCNCGACSVVCPTDAIEFKSTSLGRLYASVNDKCINCGKCQKVCPTLNQAADFSSSDGLLGKISSVSVGKATDAAIFRNSQSGGICTALLKFLFETHRIDAALVCRMDYGDPVPEVRPMIVTNVDELKTSQKSCYSPVELLGILKGEISRFKSIAVVGIGCQIEGLSLISRINKEFEKKIYCRIGLICDRTLCGTIQNVYASYTPHFQAIKIAWRCKSLLGSDLHLRYETAPLVITDRNGAYKSFPNSFRFALKDMFTSPRCRVCPDKLNLCSDITLGDPWRMTGIDWENGDSLVVGRTELGEDILAEAKAAGYFSLSSRPTEQLYKGQLIEERCRQIADYAGGFHVLNPTVHSHLLTPSVPSGYKVEAEGAENEFRGFVVRETLSQREIIKQARLLIKKYSFKKTLPGRIIVKLINIFR